MILFLFFLSLSTRGRTSQKRLLLLALRLVSLSRGLRRFSEIPNLSDFFFFTDASLFSAFPWFVIIFISPANFFFLCASTNNTEHSALLLRVSTRRTPLFQGQHSARDATGSFETLPLRACLRIWLSQVSFFFPVVFPYGPQLSGLFSSSSSFLFFPLFFVCPAPSSACRPLAADCRGVSLARLLRHKRFPLSSACSWLVSMASWICTREVYERERRMGHSSRRRQTAHAGQTTRKMSTACSVSISTRCLS